MKHADSIAGVDLRMEDRSWILFDASVYNVEHSEDKLCLWVDMGKHQGTCMVLPTRNFITHGDEALVATNTKL